MKINWKVRIKNKVFWLAFIPAMLMLIKTVANVFGLEIDLHIVETNLIGVVEAVFVLLGIVGIVTDPTTEGLSDSKRALTYDEPNK